MVVGGELVSLFIIQFASDYFRKKRKDSQTENRHEKIVELIM